MLRSRGSSPSIYNSTINIAYIHELTSCWL